MSMISPIRATLAALAFAVSYAACPAQAAPFAVERGLNMDQWVTWPSAEQWNTEKVLGNFPEWKSFVSGAELDELRTAGLDFLRMPVDPTVFLVDMDETRKDRLFAGVTEAIDRIRAAGLKVVVDLHTIPRGNDTEAPGTQQVLGDPEVFAAYRRLVNDIAGRLMPYEPEAVALELINEPLLDCGRRDTEWRDLLIDLHAAARAANPKITLVAPGACWGSADGLVALDPDMLGDANVIWSFHSYDPFILTHQGASWAGQQVEHLSGLPYPFSEADRSERRQAVEANRARLAGRLSGGAEREAKAFLADHSEKLANGFRLRREMRRPFRLVAAWADRNDIPHDRILLGEFGMIHQDYDKEPSTKHEWRAAYYRDMIALAEEHGFAWSMWSYSGAFGIVDAYNGEKADPSVMDVVRSLPPR